jgi:hypothetical protein
MRRFTLAVLCAAVVIGSAGGTSAQKGPFMDDLIPAADAQIGQSLWAMGYDGLCDILTILGNLPCAGGRYKDKIRPMDRVKIVGFVTDPTTGVKNVRLEHNGAVGFMRAHWRMWVARDPKETKCRDVSLQIGWSDDTVLRAMKCAPDHINSTSTEVLDRDQWVYGGGNYLYFEYGVLVAIQRSR